MAKLRPGAVEYKQCVCGISYEGETCPQCGHTFDPQSVRKVIYDRVILAQEEPPIYDLRQNRCRCTACDNLFDLQHEDVLASAQCPACRLPLFDKELIQKMCEKAETLLQCARQLDHARRQLCACPWPTCGKPVPPVCWCPWCRTQPDADTRRCLPQRFTKVWVRTFYVRTESDQAGKKRKKDGARPQYEEEEVGYRAQD